jgi:class 3 adenylate cyclase
MGVRERVVDAIGDPVNEAERLLAEAQHADEHTRLTILMTGWFRGLAAALEELAIELDEQRRR